MWSGKSEPAGQAWLGAGRVGWFAPQRKPELAVEAAPEAALERLAAWCEALDGRQRVRIWLGADLCRLACLPAIRGARRFDDAQEAALAWMTAQGRLQPGWTGQLAERPDDADLWRMALTPAGLIDGLKKRLGERVVSVRPWWSWVLKQHKAAQSLVCAWDGVSLVICAWNAEGKVSVAETIGPVPDIEAARRTLRRRLLQLDASLNLKCVQIDWSGLAAPDFSGDLALAPGLRISDAL